MRHWFKSRRDLLRENRNLRAANQAHVHAFARAKQEQFHQVTRLAHRVEQAEARVAELEGRDPHEASA